MRTTLRMLFNSDFFKDESVWYAKVKSPAEVVAGTMRLVQDHRCAQTRHGAHRIGDQLPGAGADGPAQR